MKKTIQNIAVGFVAILSLILALIGCNNDKKTEQQKFQPDSYYENKSVQELESLCENNDFKACHQVGENHTNIPKAIALLEKSCNGGYGMGCITLGYAYFSGEAGIKQTQKAIALYNKAIELGENEGYYWLGLLYEEGDKATRDYAKAFESYHKGCEHENINSCFMVGFVNYRGNGVKQDFAKAKELYGKACDLGDQDGCDEYKKLQQKGY